MRTETLLRLNRLISSNRLKFLAALAADVTGVRHLILRFDPVLACNLRCGMCFFSDDQWLERNPVKRFSDDEIRRLADIFFPLASQLHIGCSAEPTLYKGYPSLVSLGKQYKIPFIGFTTNGQLLTPARIQHMIEAGLDEITLSTHGVEKNTYETLMRGASYETYHRNLTMISELKRSLGRQNPRIRINYTVNPDNLCELRRFFEVFGNYDISTIQVRPIIDFGDTDYKNKDLIKHKEEYNEIIEELILQCRLRGISCLMNRMDPGYEQENKFAVVYEKAILRYLNPGQVWKRDFDFMSETYREHESRLGYRRELLKYVLRGDRSLIYNAPRASSEVV
jgi:molybdenum cofactor biosynthesis enzyme MoaA